MTWVQFEMHASAGYHVHQNLSGEEARQNLSGEEARKFLLDIPHRGED